MESIIISNLLPVLEKSIGKKIKDISNFTLLASGWESKIYSFKLFFVDTKEHDLVLRAYQGDNTDAKATNEFSIMRTLSDLNIPVPKVYVLDISRTLLANNFIIMDYIHGTLMGDRMIENKNNKTKILELFRSIVLIQQSIHSLPITPFSELTSPFKESKDNNFIQTFLNYYSQILLTLQTPIFNDLLCWLKQHSAHESDINMGLLHLDFHPWNALITEDEKVFIIDWPTAMIGDIRFDIAWSLLLTKHEFFSAFDNDFLNIYKNIYSSDKLKDLNYFICLAGLRRLVDAYDILAGDPSTQGINPESKKQIKEMSFHYLKITEIVEKITNLNLGVIKESILN